MLGLRGGSGSSPWLPIKLSNHLHFWTLTIVFYECNIIACPKLQIMFRLNIISNMCKTALTVADVIAPLSCSRCIWMFDPKAIRWSENVLGQKERHYETVFVRHGINIWRWCSPLIAKHFPVWSPYTVCFLMPSQLIGTNLWGLTNKSFHVYKASKIQRP